VAEALVVDATVLIDHLRGHADATGYLSPLLARKAVALHPAVHAEVLCGARDARHLRALDITLGSVRTIRARGDDFVRALDLVRSHRLPSGIGWADCLIAATALRLRLPVVTLNDKHFKAVRGLRVIRPY
jgi:predicted nucleic acid-binding protein